MDSQPASTVLTLPGGVAHRRVLVWDLAVRIFHWSLVAGIAVAWMTGGTGSRVHEAVGYAVAALIGFRLMWGFVGPRHARFRDFLTNPRRTLSYARAHASNQAPRHLGHNPAGGYMIVALLGTIGVICVTGFMQQTSYFFGVEWVEELHHLAAKALLVLIPLHVLGALVASVMHRENLVASMIVGTKPALEESASPAAAVRARRRLRLDYRDLKLRTRPGVAALMLCLATGLAFGWRSTSHRSLIEGSQQVAASSAAEAPTDVTVAMVPAIAATLPVDVATDNALQIAARPADLKTQSVAARRLSDRKTVRRVAQRPSERKARTKRALRVDDQRGRAREQADNRSIVAQPPRAIDAVAHWQLADAAAWVRRSWARPHAMGVWGSGSSTWAP